MRNLPRTANGKVDRDTVRQCLLALRLSAHPGEPLATVLAPDDPPLQPMLALWRRLLGSVPADPSASFTQLGGTSVLALLLATAIRRELKRRVSAVELLRRPLLQDHVDLVARTPPEGPDSQAAQMPMPMPMHVPTAANEGWLTEVQVSLLMAAQLDDGTGSMLLHVAVCLPPGVTSGALKHAFATVVQRHPMLRLSVQHAGQGVQMRLLDALPPPWWTEHTAVLEQFPGDLAWPAALLAVVQRPLDLVEDGPMRVDLWPVARGGHLMVWTVHHFATDEIGIDNALHELDVLLQGQALPPVYGSPFAFSVVERSTIDHAGIRLKAQALAPDLGRVQLPFEHRGQLAGVHLYSLPAALADALRAATVRWQCTPFAPLLTAYGLALQSVFGQGARHVLTPVSRRSEPQLLEPITYFLDLRFMEAGARAGEGAAAHLQRVQLETLQAQQPACQPLPRVSQALAAIDPAAAQRTTAFVFTWREAPARSLRLGGVQARLIRAPQRGAKFGMALHAAMVDGGYSLVLEAAEPAHQGGWTGRVWQAFCRHLGEVCAVDKFDFGDAQEATTQAPAQPTGFTPAFDDPLRMLLAAAWRRWAPMTPPVPANEASFVALGWLTTITLAG